MADIKWIKLTTNMHDDEKMRLIDAMPERDTIHYLWIRLLIQAGKTNAGGLIYLNENIPYTEEMLSTIFSRPLASVRFALKVLSDFEMIEIATDNVIKIVNWEKHQNIEGMDRVREQNRKRVQNHRDRKKQLQVVAEGSGEYEDNFKDNSGESAYNISNNLCKVTKDKSNITVMEQNKRQTQNKKQIKSENKRENKNEEIRGKKESRAYDENETPAQNLIEISHLKKGQASDSMLKSETVQSSVSKSDSDFNPSISHSDYNFQLQSNSEVQTNELSGVFNKNLEDTNSKCFELQRYAETITGIPNVLNLGGLKLAVAIHGQEYVKLAIDIALRANKPNMTYIDGILKNWKREGYPRDKEVRKNVNRSYGKDSDQDKNEFTGFKAKKPRCITEPERRRAEEKLI